MLKYIVKRIIKDYNNIILDVNKDIIQESSNPYGHVKEFNKLKKSIKYEAHRVISPLAVRLADIEDTYSVTDINGNTYIFDIFEDGYYRISEVRKLKDESKEVVDEKYFKANC